MGQQIPLLIQPLLLVLALLLVLGEPLAPLVQLWPCWFSHWHLSQWHLSQWPC